MRCRYLADFCLVVSRIFCACSPGFSYCETSTKINFIWNGLYCFFSYANKFGEKCRVFKGLSIDTAHIPPPSRTHGVSIFIDYFIAAAMQRKVEGKERDTGLINRTRSTAVQPGATWCLMACARRGALIRAPPPSHTPQQDYGQNLATSLKVEDGLHLGVFEYDG